MLLSPDDEVRLSPELWKDEENINEKEFKLQARPNVLFEAGMAFGKDPDRTILVEVGQVKAFSDVGGRHVVKLSNSSDKRNEIAERLRTAGCDVSTSGNDWLKTGNFNVNRKEPVGNLKKLEKMNLEINALSSLPREIAYLTKLKDLSLAFNRFEFMPLEVCQLVNMRRLRLSTNPISSLPREIVKLHQLEELDLEGTRLTELPSEVQELRRQNLKKVRI